MLITYFDMCTLLSLFTCLASLPVKLHFITTPNQPFQLKIMGAIVSQNALLKSIWQPVHDVTTALLPVCRAATSCTVCIWDLENYVVKMVICAANECYNRSDKGKGKGISFFSIPKACLTQRPRWICFYAKLENFTSCSLFGSEWTIPNESTTYTTQSKDADIRTKQIDKTKFMWSVHDLCWS